MFFFLSGFGLVRHMMTRYSNPFHFYKRRFFVIYPAYFIATSLFFTIDFIINGKTTLRDILLSITTIGFWLDNSSLYWFIPSIFSLYIVYPLFFRYYLKYQLKLIFLASATAFILSIILISNNNDHFTSFLTRIPIFLIGSHVSYNSFNSSQFLTKQTVACNIAAFAFSFGMLLILMFNHFNIAGYGLEYYLFAIGTPPLCLFASIMLDIVPPPLLFLLSCCGALSLEIYLVHKQIVFRLGEMLLKSSMLNQTSAKTFNYGHYLEYLAYFIISICTAYLLQNIANILRTYISQPADAVTSGHAPTKQIH